MNKTQVKTVLVTGPNGFIGRHLISEIKRQFPQWNIKVISRNPVKTADGFLDFQQFRRGDFESSFFEGVNYFIHLAGLAHCFKKPGMEDLESVNIRFFHEVLLRLDLQSLDKIIFMSSYSVTLLDKGVVLDTVPYAMTKKRAEELLNNWYQKTPMNFEVVVLRPSMVYGKGAPGNFDRILSLVKLPVLLPFGALSFPRSFIQIGNLVSAVLGVLKFPSQPKMTIWDISDPWVETFRGFVEDLKANVSGRAKIFTFPTVLLKCVLLALGKRALFEKLILSFEIDSEPFSRSYQWIPPVNFFQRFDDLKQ